MLFSPLGFEILKNYDSEILEFKHHSFRAFQRYLTNENSTASIFQFGVLSFESTLAFTTNTQIDSSWTTGYQHTHF